MGIRLHKYQQTRPFCGSEPQQIPTNHVARGYFRPTPANESQDQQFTGPIQ